MTKMHVAVLRGGPSSLYELSLKNGAGVLSALPEEQFTVRDIFIDRSGTWHSRGVESVPQKALEGVDVVINAMVGEYGEDGTVQKILRSLGVPFVGSDAFSSAVVIDKAQTHQRARTIGVRVPAHIVVKVDTANENTTQEIFAQFGPPYIIKPLRGSASLQITIAHSVLELAVLLETALAENESVLVEQYITGTPVSVGLVEGMRDEELYALPPAEIVLPQGEFYLSHEHKLADEVEVVCPSTFSSETKKALENAARALHKELGMQHFSRFDFIVTKNGAPYLLEANTLTELTPHSPFVQSLDAVGIPLSEFLAHVALLAKK